MKHACWSSFSFLAVFQRVKVDAFSKLKSKSYRKQKLWPSSPERAERLDLWLKLLLNSSVLSYIDSLARSGSFKPPSVHVPAPTMVCSERSRKAKACGSWRGSALSFSRQMSAKGLICRINPLSCLFSVLQANDLNLKKTTYFSVENIDFGDETFILLTARSEEGAEIQSVRKYVWVHFWELCCIIFIQISFLPIAEQYSSFMTRNILGRWSYDVIVFLKGRGKSYLVFSYLIFWPQEGGVQY